MLLMGILFDGYHFTADEINLAGHLSQSVAYVADHMSISDVDLIIRPGQPRMKGDPRNTLSGLKYAMISPRFSRYSSVDISPQIGSILIAFGLRDSKNATCKVLEALKYIGNTYNVNPDIYVTIGKETPHLYQIKGLVNALPNAELLLDHNDMPGLMKNCDFAIGAGGVGLLERMAAGLPSITVSIAENQVNQSQLCARAGGTIYLGPVEGLDDDLLISCLVDLFRDNLHRAELSCKAREAVDGTGVLKVAEALMQLGCHDNGVEYSAEQGRLNG